jgi:hypothetical protein
MEALLGTRFKKARFHISTGPASLFDRVRFKMCGCRELNLHAAHLQERADKYDVPLGLFRSFDPNIWKLVTAEVRTDTGRFINSAWEVNTGDRSWWVIIGLHDTVETAFPVERKKGLGSSIVTRGPLYDFVEKVNKQLMELE